MDNKETNYSLVVKVQNISRFKDESDDNFAERVQKEGRRMVKNYLSGNLYDPEHKIIFEKINFKKLNNQ